MMQPRNPARSNTESGFFVTCSGIFNTYGHSNWIKELTRPPMSGGVFNLGSQCRWRRGVDAIASQSIHFQVRQARVMPSADRARVHLFPDCLFQSDECTRVRVIRAENGFFCATPEVMGKKDPMVGGHVVPD
jgi:hypothetical protein